MDKNSDTQTVALICDHVGRKVLADRLGVGKTAIGNAVSENLFPARWYVEVKALCDAHGLSCPASLFSFVRSEPKPEAAE